jgi:hypothetical protein
LVDHPSDPGPRPQLTRTAASWGPKSLLPADARTPTAHPATGPSLGQVMLSVPIIATTTCADFRCALGRFVGCTYRPRLLPGAAGRQSPRPPDAGAQTDLSSCVLGCANVPIPLRRTVPRGCNSKVFTPSMSFAQSGMGSAPSRLRQEGGIVTTLQDSIHATDRLLARPQKGLCHDASTLRISPRAGHQLHGCLAITVAGLPPASRTHAQDAPDRQSRESLMACAWCCPASGCTPA